MFKKVSITLVLILLLAAAGWLLGSRRAADGEGAQAGRGRAEVAVECASLQRGEIRDIREFTGSLSARSRYICAPKTAGRLVSVAAEIGDPVEPDEVIARLDDEEFVQQVQQARASLDVARATLEQARVDLELAQREQERVRSLREQGIASETEWDSVQSEYRSRLARLRVAEAQVAERESALKAAEVRLSYTRIRPLRNSRPGSWFVEERFVDEGSMLAANTPVLAVIDIASLTAVIRVIERDYPAMSVGLPVLVTTDAFPGEVFDGAVVRIAPALRESSRQARVEIEIPNDSLKLRPGMFVRAQIEFGIRSNALLAPLTALVTREGAKGLFLIDEETETAEFVEVRTGISDGERVEILEPELEGLVATLGHHLLSDGATVRICEDIANQTESVSNPTAPPAPAGNPGS